MITIVETLFENSFANNNCKSHLKRNLQLASWIISIQYCIENITRWRERMKFIFEWKKYFTSERIFFLLHSYECFENKKKTRRKTKEKQRNDVSDIFTSEDMENSPLVSRT